MKQLLILLLILFSITNCKSQDDPPHWIYMFGGKADDLYFFKGVYIRLDDIYAGKGVVKLTTLDTWVTPVMSVSVKFYFIDTVKHHIIWINHEELKLD